MSYYRIKNPHIYTCELKIDFFGKQSAHEVENINAFLYRTKSLIEFFYYFHRKIKRNVSLVNK